MTLDRWKWHKVPPGTRSNPGYRPMTSPAGAWSPAGIIAPRHAFLWLWPFHYGRDRLTSAPMVGDARRSASSCVRRILARHPALGAHRLRSTAAVEGAAALPE